jgi:hypothetical protein
MKTHMNATAIRGSGALAMAALLACALAGCDSTKYALYLMAPEDKGKTVEAEYKGLEKKTVAVIIYADQSVMYEYPYARLGLSMRINSELKKRVDKVTVIDPVRVIKYQDQNIRWDTEDKARLAKALGADRLLYVALEEYRLRDAGGSGTFNGRIVAQASVTEVENPAATPAWRCEEVQVAFPPNDNGSTAGMTEAQVCYATEMQLAGLLVNKFVSHEGPKEEPE